MPGLVLLGQGDTLGGGIAIAGLSVAVAACFIAVQWRKVRHAQMEAELKREMIQKGLPADEIERVLKASTPPQV
jgi:hypothetical protein